MQYRLRDLNVLIADDIYAEVLACRKLFEATFESSDTITYAYVFRVIKGCGKTVIRTLLCRTKNPMDSVGFLHLEIVKANVRNRYTLELLTEETVCVTGKIIQRAIRKPPLKNPGKIVHIDFTRMR